MDPARLGAAAPGRISRWIGGARGSSFVRFALGGLLTYAATIGVLALWLAVGLPGPAAYAVTHCTVLALGFVLNRYWIFRARAGRATAQGIRFVVASLGFRFVDWCVYSAIDLTLGLPAPLTVMLANLSALPLKFHSYRSQVFGPGRPRQDGLAERPT